MKDSKVSCDNSSVDSNQRVRELETLHRASVHLHRLRDPAVLARDVITLLKDVVHHDFAAVYLIAGEQLKTFAVSDRGLGPGVLESDLAYLDTLELKVGKNITGWVAEQGKSVRLEHVSGDERYLDSQADIESELCVPMWSGNQVIGVVNLESTRKSAYKKSDQRVLEIVANQIAIAIENGQLLQRATEVKRLQLLAELTDGVAHDIGNLLVAIALRCDLLRSHGALSDLEKEELTAIRTVLDKTISMSRRLMQVGLPQPATNQTMCLNDHLRNAMPLLEALGGNRMRVRLDLCDGAVHIDGHTGQFDQILINLTVNARAAIGAGGTLRFRTVREAGPVDSAGRLRFEVQDSGCGMTQETLRSAMEPLFSTRENGSGLGLATVARLVEELNGTISLQSEKSVGTLVSITLPIQRPDAVASQSGGPIQET